MESGAHVNNQHIVHASFSHPNVAVSRGSCNLPVINIRPSITNLGKRDTTNSSTARGNNVIQTMNNKNCVSRNLNENMNNNSNVSRIVGNNARSAIDGKRKRDSNSSENVPPANKKMAVPRSVVLEMLPPKIFLCALLRKRGYSTETYSVMNTGYYNKPTDFQQASYGTRITQAARTGDSQTLHKLIKCGLSRNPCNKFGESMVHIVCRRGKKGCAYDVLNQLCEIGCELQVCDDFGKTPLHDACWTVDPCFKTITLILSKDIRLLHMKDRRGSTPLDYLRKEKWKDMIEYLISKREQFWPQRDVAKEGEESPPLRSTFPPHSHMIPDPLNALPISLAVLVAAGKIEPESVMIASKEEIQSFHKKLMQSMACSFPHEEVSFQNYVFTPQEKANFTKRHFHVSFPTR